MEDLVGEDENSSSNLRHGIKCKDNGHFNVRETLIDYFGFSAERVDKTEPIVRGGESKGPRQIVQVHRFGFNAYLQGDKERNRR